MRRGLFFLFFLIIPIACTSLPQEGQDLIDLTSNPITSLATNTLQPGLLIEGYVNLKDGSELEGVGIYRSYASYPGELIATTDSTGFYLCAFQPIPGDEMVRVWAELEGYSIDPKDSSWTWQPGSYAWRHYHGYDYQRLDFIAEKSSND